ncbi:MAG: aminoacyl-tRNA hydrolase [Tidjanibacter sp.]|nr:aminoacyl-tRNA hydrolase [Tidjanibacter sp.]
MKYLVVGLGNIGAKYLNTRHNMGFNVVDAMALKADVQFRINRYGAVAEMKHKGRTIILLKPSTYMNESGKAVRYWLEKEKISKENLMVVVDDLALPLGAMRIRGKGSNGGHNGLRNIDELTGGNDYARLRFGIGNDFPQGMQIEFVLGEFNSEERKELVPRVEEAVEAIKCFVTQGLNQTMNIYNKKSIGAKPKAVEKTDEKKDSAQ